YYYKPRVDWELLGRHGSGLIALSDCLSGHVCKALEENRDTDAEAELDRLEQVFGRDRVYVELQNAHLDVQQRIMPQLVELAERCNVEIELGRILLPTFDTPEGRDAFEYLVELVEAGAAKRYGNVTPELRERLKFELKTIKEMGFSDYFLIVADLIGFARRNGVSVGPGRGSSAGSIVAYSLEITDLDPIRYDLLFERFL